jgi:hypothetical protein
VHTRTERESRAHTHAHTNTNTKYTKIHTNTWSTFSTSRRECTAASGAMSVCNSEDRLASFAKPPESIAAMRHALPSVVAFIAARPR